MNDLKSFIIKEAACLEIEINESQAALLQKYWDLLLAWNKKINLISSRVKVEESLVLHLLDSLLPLKYHKPRQNIRVVDFGSGGGLPAIPLKIMNPDWNYTLVEATEKKTVFLKEVGRRLNFDKFEILNSYLRGAENPVLKDKFDLITVRGLAETPVLLKLGAGWLKADGVFWLYKGPKWPQEINSAQKEFKKWNLEIKEIWPAQLPLINQPRTILVIGFGHRSDF